MSKKPWVEKEKLGWKELPVAGIVPEGGTARYFETGSWRSLRPVLDKEKCRHCLFCWIYCPDSAVKVKDKKMEGFDLKFCKGCTICSTVCPAKAIKMVPETKSAKAGGNDG